MKKVVLGAVNARYSHTSLAAWILAEAVLGMPGISAVVAETNINQAQGEIVDALTADNPYAVCVGAYIWNAEILPETLRGIRARLPGALIILGGPEASFNAEYWLRSGADYVVRGEGEEALPALLRAVENGTAEKIFTAKERKGTQRINPYIGGYTKAVDGKIAYIETSRGCPYTCKFCLSGLTGGVRFFPLDEAKERIRILAGTNARTIKFVDRTFNCDAKRAYEIFEYVIKLPTTRRFHFEVAPELFDERTLELLKTAPPGRIQLEAGLQSFNARALAAVSRKTDTDRVLENLRKLAGFGNIHLHVDLIAGLPYESLEAFAEGFDRAWHLAPRTLQLGFLKLLHGSKLREEYGGIIKTGSKAPYEVTESPWLSTSDIRTLKQAENALNHTYNKARFLFALRYVLQAADTGPFRLFHGIGEAVPNKGTPLGLYTEGIYNYLLRLPGIDKDELLEHIVCDWLQMVKGNDMPGFMKIHNKEQKRKAISAAEKLLGRTIRRDEAAVLPSTPPCAVCVDSTKRDPVTGLYEIHRMPL